MAWKVTATNDPYTLKDNGGIIEMEVTVSEVGNPSLSYQTILKAPNSLEGPDLVAHFQYEAKLLLGYPLTFTDHCKLILGTDLAEFADKQEYDDWINSQS